MRALGRARQARGAALVEALVVIPTLTLLWAALVFVASVYGKKLATRAEARAAVWTYALNSCEGGSGQRVAGDGASLDQVTADPESVQGAGLSGEAGDFAGEARSQTDLEFGDSWGVAQASSERPGNSLFSFSSGSVSTTLKVQCDEKPRGADPVSVLTFLWDLRNTVNLQ